MEPRLAGTLPGCESVAAFGEIVPAIQLLEYTDLELVLATFGVPREGADGTLIFMIQMGAIFAIFYFLLIRPQRKEQQRHQQMIKAVKKGDEIVTAGGIIGTVVHAQDERITVKTGESTRVVVERGRIARVVPAAGDEE